MENKRSKKWVYIVLVVLLLALLAVGIFLYQIYSNGPEATAPSTAPTTTHSTPSHTHTFTNESVVMKTATDCVHNYNVCECGHRELVGKSAHTYDAETPIIVYDGLVAIQYESKHTCTKCQYWYNYILDADDIEQAGLPPITELNAAHVWIENEIEVDEATYLAYLESKGLTDDTPVADGYLSRYFEKTITCEHCDIAEVEVSRRDEPIPQLPDDPNEPHVCAFTHRTVVTKATCTEGGKTVKYCVCGKTTETNKTNKLGHKYGAWTVRVQATCEQQGIEFKTCSRCGHEETRGVKKSAHDFGEATFMQGAGCEGTGTSIASCKVCGVTESKLVYGNNHSFGEWQYVAGEYYDDHYWDELFEEYTATMVPTHTHKFRTCSKCGVEERIELPKHQCAYGKGDLYSNFIRDLREGDCLTQKSEYYECTICGYNYTKWWKSMGNHQYEVSEDVLCEQDEYHNKITLETWHCELCGHKTWDVWVDYQYVLAERPRRYNISVSLPMSYFNDIPMSGEGEPDPRWKKDAAKYYEKRTNPVFDTDGYLTEYTIYWWDTDGKMYETLVNLKDCYELFLEECPTWIPEGMAHNRITFKFAVGDIYNTPLPVGISYS